MQRRACSQTPNTPGRTLTWANPASIMCDMDSLPTRVSLRRNIELKARLKSLAEARQIARSVAHQRLPDQHQVDTYFRTFSGRLKLREIRGCTAELISYARDDRSDAKESSYCLVPVADPAVLKQALAAALGIRQCVEKAREIYLHENVRIHLDVVAGLGEFLEFEAVLDEGHDEAAARALLRDLQQCFRIADDDLVAPSYVDLLDSEPVRSGTAQASPEKSGSSRAASGP